MPRQTNKATRPVQKPATVKTRAGLFAQWPDNRNSESAAKLEITYNGAVTAEDKLTLILSALTGLLQENPELKPVLDKKLRTLRPHFLAEAGALKGHSKKPQWRDPATRRNRDPAQFIRDEYSAELKAGTLTRKLLRNVDKPLYDAYANWITPKRHPEDDLGLPKTASTNLDELNDPVEHVRKQRRETSRRWRLRQR
ncbi:hypothetical protein [uncultured Hyphomicrobium sp.]|jgi:hypothetical protein|uniref:hypothetical protein n=1 Tax=uncultured Hyphomicrobium sp. TaxID=194373 RepID=UPI0025DE7809|nr:hypothetical protein [uncultured Hyphomicrobium sp.]